MRTLLVFQDDHVRDVIAFGMETKFSAQVTGFKTAPEAIPFLQGRDKPEMIICDHPINSEMLFKYLRLFKLNIPVVLCPTAESSTKEAFDDFNIVGLVHRPNLLNDLNRVVEDFLKAERYALTAFDGEFCRIKTDLLLHMGKLESDIYIKLSPKKFLKLFNAGDEFDITDHHRVAYQKKLEYLYVKNADTAQVVIKLRSDLTKAVNAPDLTPDKAGEIAMRIYDTVQQLVTRLGPTPEVQKLVKASFVASLKAIGAKPTLRQTLSFLHYRREQYLASHSLLLSNVACSLAAAMGWISNSTFMKLNYASLLHDVALDNNELAAIQSVSELEQRAGQFSAEEAQAYRLHPIHAAQIASKFDEIPSDVDMLLTQHHERPDGGGFPHALSSSRLNPLSCLFIVAHDLVSAIIRANGKLNVPEYIQSIKPRYSTGTFKQILKMLETTKL